MDNDGGELAKEEEGGGNQERERAVVMAKWHCALICVNLR